MNSLPDLSETPAGSASVAGSGHQVSGATSVSRETSTDRRRENGTKIPRHDGRLERIESGWRAEQLRLVGRLVAANCTAADIARHFTSTPEAIRTLARRNGFRWPTLKRPAVAEVLASLDLPVVTLLDRFERYVGKVELHEVDDIGRARIRHVNPQGLAGRWETAPVLLLRFEPQQDRAALIAQAKQRHAATQARRAVLHSSGDGNGAS